MTINELSRSEYLTSSRSTPLITRRLRRSIWSNIYPLFTILIPTIIIRYFLKPINYNNENEQERENLNNKIESWREKIALVSIIILLCIIMGILTIGMQKIFCKTNNQLIYGDIKNQYENGELKENIKKRNERANIPNPIKYTFFNGSVYKSPNNKYHNEIIPDLINIKHPNCKKGIKGKIQNGIKISELHLNGNDIINMNTIRIKDRIYNLDFIKIFKEEMVTKEFLIENINYISLKGNEIIITNNKLNKEEENCIKCTLERIFIGKITSKSYGCLFTNIILYLGTVIIFSLLIIKFLLASIYNFYIKIKLNKSKNLFNNKLNEINERKIERNYIKYELNNLNELKNIKNKKFQSDKLKGSPTITLITAYSEGKEGLKITLDSLNEQTYNNQIIWIICDGLVKGEGGKLTPLEAINLMTDIFYISEPSAYYSIAEGNKSINTCIVIAALYKTVRTLIIIKYGNNIERNELNNKPGNRGKRDSQIILMSFLQKYFYKDRFTPLDLEIYKSLKIFKININEIDFLSMVDADTLLNKTALYNFALAYFSDEDVIGICGETQISNKNYNFTTMCQVFEYFISHFLNKSFESIFGGVTCLPGCFCSYRVIKRKNKKLDLELNINNENSFVPIVCNTQIVNSYSQSKLPSLHYKNLYSLGEDRFLTTLTLKTFYKQKLIFIPQAKCYTEVPNNLTVLFSQRRRWINSTVHNLFVLSGVDKLCGTFCCSMQFVAIFDIFGTLVLPAAILFTFLLIIKSFLFEPEWIPLIMLALIFGFPALMVFLTNFDLRLFYYLLVYIVSLPMWNFALPIYAFWHFDDFSWGQTRIVIIDDKQEKDKVVINNKQTIVKMTSYDEVIQKFKY